MQASFAANGDWRGLEAFLSAQPDGAGDQGRGGGPSPRRPDAAGGHRAQVRQGPDQGRHHHVRALANANEPQLRRVLLEADMLAPADIATWPTQAAYAAKGDWQGLSKHNEKHAQQGARKPKAAKATSSVQAAEADDLTQLSGIGPRMSSILADGGVTSYEGLQHASTEELRQLVSKAGVLPPSSLDTWPAQAGFAAKGDWRGLAEYNKRHHG